MQKPAVIFFDAVGTLFGVRGTVGKVYGEIAAGFGVEVTANAIDWAFGQVFREVGSPAFPGARAEDVARLERDWWRRVAIETFDRAGVLMQFEDFDPFFTVLFEHFATEKPWELYGDTIPTLEALRSAGMNLGIISNFDSRLYRVLEALDLAQYFSTVTISTEVGVAKPEAGIFQVALRKHQCLALQAWHVGDSLSEDYRAARSAGLRGILVDRGN
jgi:putative hydrolase of the HAD superfamily